MKLLFVMAVAAFLFGIAPIGEAGALQSRGGEQDAALAAIKRGEIMSYGRIRKLAEKRFDGRLVGEKLRQTGRGWVYEVRVRQQNGQVVFAVLDARTGKILRSGGRR